MITLNQYTGGETEGLTAVIYHKKTGEYFIPSVFDGAKWELHWVGAPGKLTCKLVRDETLKMEYGDTIDVSWNGKQFFHGFIFEMRRGKDQYWDIIAYDQLRYLLNKDTFSYTGKKASEVIKELAEDFELLVGELDDTGYVIDKRREANASILDMCQTALDLTMIHTDRLFTLYDDCGKLMLKDLEEMQSNLLIDAETAQDYSYTGTIDKGTYNLIKLDVDDGDNGHKTIYAPATAKEYEASESRKQWGVLQYHASVNAKNQNPRQLADSYLKHFNRISRTLSIKGAAGDLSIRGGAMLWININLGETGWGQQDTEAKRLIVQNVVHTFSNHEHTMDMDVIGDKITGISSGSGGGSSGGSNANKSAGKLGAKVSTGLSAGANAYVGQTMANGSKGCTEAVGKMGSYYSPFLKSESQRHVYSVRTLVSDARSKGIQVLPFNAGSLEAGDSIVYGNNSHVVLYDGHGGYYGNSTSKNRVAHGSDYRKMGGLSPSAIIKTSRG